MSARLLVALLLACPAGLLWEAMWRNLDALHEKRRNCVHVWGPVKQVTIGFKVWCQKCQHQEFCHQDGTICEAPCSVCGRGRLD